MIFRPELIRLITAGKKTQTRRVIRAADPATATRTTLLDGHRVLYPYAPGDTVAVQPGRGKHATARILVTDVHAVPLGDITYQDAVAEGFRTTQDFKAYWVRLHDPAWVSGSEYPEHGEYLPDTVLADRFDRAHAPNRVWAIQFTLDTTHRPRLLTPATRPRGDELGYTENLGAAMRDAGEAIDPALLEHYTRDAHERFTGEPGRRAELARRRLRSLHERAKRLNRDGVDVTSAIDQLEQHLTTLEQQRKAA